jgi:hypothetical protein
LQYNININSLLLGNTDLVDAKRSRAGKICGTGYETINSQATHAMPI